tara:strand:+ start:5347 stop:5571 length:225 start_codon:yes stop_codon:yes gene_type:complete
MEILNSNFFISVCISLIYFILKTVVEKNKDLKKKILKDSVLVGVVSYAVLIFRSNFVTFESTKSTTIFTNEPQF